MWRITLPASLRGDLGGKKRGNDEGDDLSKPTVELQSTPRATMHSECAGDGGEVGVSVGSFSFLLLMLCCCCCCFRTSCYLCK